MLWARRVVAQGDDLQVWLIMVSVGLIARINKEAAVVDTSRICRFSKYLF